MRRNPGWFRPILSDTDQRACDDKGLPLPLSTACWHSDRVNFLHEWRVYVLDGQVLGDAQYDQGKQDAELSAEERGYVAAMIETWGDDAPIAYALDVGRLADGAFALVEVTDAWGIGYYGNGSCAPRDYARWLEKRWSQFTKSSSKNDGCSAS